MRLPHPPIHPTAADRQKFMRRVLVAASGCWLWQGPRDAKGYGHYSIGRRSYRAHRVAYEMFKGEHPGELFVCHACDNPPCVNPAHLWLGTTTDNQRDMLAKRHPDVPAGHCPRCGHHRTDDYRHRRPDGRRSRRCRNCERLRDINRRDVRREARANARKSA